MPAASPKPSSEGFVYGPADKTYSVSDIPQMKARIARNPGLKALLQPLIDRLEAGDFDKSNLPEDKKPPDTTPPDTTPPDTTDPAEYSYKGITAQNIIEHLGEVSQLTPEQLGVADVNQDGTISIGDASWILQMAEGLRDPDTLEGIPQPDPEDVGDDTMTDPDFPGGMSQEDIDAAIQKALGEYAPNLEDYAKAGDIESAIQKALGEYAPEGPDLGEYAKAGDIESAIQKALGEYAPEGPDLGEYAKTGDMDAAIKAALAGYTPEYAPAEVDLSEYAKTGDTQSAIEAALAGYAPDLGEYAKTGDIEAALAGYAPDLGDYAKTGDTQATIEAALADYAKTGDFDFSDYMTAADAEELFKGMDTGQIEASVLEKMGVPGFMTNQAVQDAINTALAGQGDMLGEEDIKRIIGETTGAPDLSDYMSKSDIAQAIKASTQGLLDKGSIDQMISSAQLQGMSEEQIQQMIKDVTGGTMSDEAIRELVAESQLALEEQMLGEDAIQNMINDGLEQGLSEDDILAMIKEQFGDQMSDEDIMDAITTAQEGQYTSLMDEVNTLIADSLEQGMSEDDILTLIQTEFGETMSDDDIMNAIAAVQEDILTTEEIQKLIAEGLENGLSEQEILDLIKTQYGDQMTDDQILQAITTAQDDQYTAMMDEVNKLIADALTQGMSPEQIAAMIKDQFGETMSDDEILDAIAAAQEGVPTIQTIEAMIADALANGMSPEDIQTMISDYLGDSGLLSADDIATMIADAIAGIETTPAEDALTADAVQQMIDTAMAQGMSTEQVEAMLAESGYMGEEGIQGLIGSTLEGALGQGGSISQAIQAALAATGDTGTDTGVPEMDFTQPYTPGSFPTSPYGEVDPYSLMGTNQFAGTTPFSGGTTTGAASSTGLGTLNLGDPAQYNFDIPTTLGVDLYPSGIDPKYFEPPPEEPEGPYDPRKDPRFWID